MEEAREGFSATHSTTGAMSGRRPERRWRWREDVRAPAATVDASSGCGRAPPSRRGVVRCSREARG